MVYPGAIGRWEGGDAEKINAMLGRAALSPAITGAFPNGIWPWGRCGDSSNQNTPHHALRLQPG
jgi:hypothetical protein